MSESLRILALLVSFVSTSACSVDMPLESAPESVGPEGRTIEYLGGTLTIIVPPAALDSTVQITVRAVNPTPNAPTLIPGTGLEISPVNLQFNRDVIVKLKFFQNQIPEASGILEAELGAYRTQLGVWSALPGAVVNTIDNEITVPIRRLGTFALLGIPVTLVDASPSSLAIDSAATATISASVRGTGNVVLPQRRVSWSSLNPTLVAVDSVGQVRGVGVGLGRVVVTSGGVDDTIPVEVRSLAPPPPPSADFEPADYIPIVQRRFDSKATTNADRGTGTFPLKSGGSEGFDGVEFNRTDLNIVSDGTAPFSPPNVMRATYRAVTTASTSTYSPGPFQTLPFTSSAHGSLQYRHLYLRTAFKVSSNWQAHPNGASPKLVFFRTGQTVRVDNVLVLLDEGPDFVVGWNLQGSSRDTRQGVNQNVGAPNDDRIRIGQWNIVEVRVVLNTLAQKNGILQVWLNGKLILNYSDIEFLPSATVPDFWSTGHFNSTWGGQGGTINQEMYLFWDDVYFSGKP